MRLPVRTAGVLALFVLAAGIAAAQELSGGGLAQTPNQITSIEATSSRTTDAAPQPFGYESEVHCFGYLGSSNERFVAKFIGAENSAEQTDYTTNDLMYLDAGADRGIKPGDEFWIVTPGEIVNHPITGKELGRFYQYRGRSVVVCIEGRTSTVRITMTCTDVPMGSFLKPYEPVPIPLGRKQPACVACDPPSGKAKGRIVYSRDGVYSLGQDSDVFIDLGIAEGVQPGDQLSIFRYAAAGAEYGIRPQGSYWLYAPPPPGVTVPRTYLGEMAILYVGDRWAMGRVIDSSRLIELGDEVELK